MKMEKISLSHLDEVRKVSSREEIHEKLHFGHKGKMGNFQVFWAPFVS